MSRLPIRLRLSLVFALTMAVLLAAVGAFLYVSLRAALDEQIDESLEARADDLAALATEELVKLPGDDDRFAQLLDADRNVLAGPDPAPDGFRTLEFSAGDATLVVGQSLDDRDEALATLLFLLLVGGPVALVFATLAGYRLAGAALRPVESMRREAADISSATSGRRLPVPESRDEVRRLGETLNEMLERLDAGLRRERRFVADASHELRTPLALLQTELELALRRPRAPEELESALRSARQEVDRLTRLAENLLLLERTEPGGAPLQRTTFPARELLVTVAGRFEAEGRTLEVDAGEDLVVSADRIRLEQALGNLVDNALRHGGGRVRLAARREDGSLLLSVSDEGVGFPPELAGRAFERFSRADQARSTGGAGLGLAIVDAVARAHGGTASVSGATVTLALPSHEALISPP